MEDLCKIRDLYRAITEFEEQFHQQYQLSLNEGMLLCTLLERPKLNAGQIVEAMGLSTSNTSKVIRSAEKKKLISRRVGRQDKRQMYFMLTEEGEHRIKTIKEAEIKLPEELRRVIGCL